MACSSRHIVDCFAVSVNSRDYGKLQMQIEELRMFGLALGSSTIVILIASLVAATTDVWKFKVYNLLTLPLLLSGLVYRGWTGGVEGFSGSLTGMLFGFGLFLLPYLWGAVGAGDVKFVAAVGAWLGMQPMLPILLIGCLATGVYAVVLLVLHNGREAHAGIIIAGDALEPLLERMAAHVPHTPIFAMKASDL